MRKIRYFELCSGIGAAHSAFDITGGFKCVGWCEFDSVPQLAYRTLYNTKNEVFFNDARTLNPADIPPFDLLIGGIPCQSWSAAGLRRGFADERGQLFFDFARILEARKPPLFIIENVPALLTADSGNAFCTILSEIHKLGYSAEWQIVDGSAYLPQKRKRLFLIGFLDPRLSFEIFPIGIGNQKAIRQLVGGSQGQRIYDPSGASCTIMATGGGVGSKGGTYFVDLNPDPKITEDVRCITARQDSGISNHRGEHSGVLIEESLHFVDLNENPKIEGEMHKGERSGVMIDEDGTYPCLTPDRDKIRQQGRRIRENGAPAFCITATDRNGVIHKGRVRRLLPIETWRLMGFTDEQFHKVQAVIPSDAKLYKLAGNSIMVPVLVDLATKLKAVIKKYGILEDEK